jgi:L-iditol 2-dehydrogenase
MRLSWACPPHLRFARGRSEQPRDRYAAVVRRASWTDTGLAVLDEDPGPLTEGVARLRVAACGICGTDLHHWAGTSPRKVGTTPGHEFVGTLVDAPPGLADALYAVSPNVTCGACEFCESGQLHLCRRGGFGIGLGRNGGLADLVDVPVRNLFAVPAGVDPLVASLAEPLAVCIRAMGHARAEPDSRALIIGAGTLGLLSAVALRDAVHQVAVIARYPHQSEIASSYGVTALNEQDAEAWGKEFRPDIVIETVGGGGSTVDTALRMARRGARLILLGSFGIVPVNLGLAMSKEVRIVPSSIYGTGRRGQQFAAAVQLLPRWRDAMRPLLTHQFSLEDVEAAFTCASNKTTGSLKVTVRP